MQDSTDELLIQEASGAFQRDEFISIFFWLRRKLIPIWLKFAIIILFTLGILYVLRGLFSSPTYLYHPMVLACVIVILCYPYQIWSFKRTISKQFDQFYGEDPSVLYTWNDEFFKFRSSKVETSILWRQAVNWVLGDNVLMIYITNMQAVFCPLRLFTLEQRDDLLLQLKRHDIPERFKRKRGN